MASLTHNENLGWDGAIRVAVIGAGFSGALFASNIEKELKDLHVPHHVDVRLSVYELIL